MKFLISFIFAVILSYAPEYIDTRHTGPSIADREYTVYQWLRLKQGTIYAQGRDGKFYYVWWLTEKNCRRIAYLCVKFADEYQDEEFLIVRHLWQETNCRWWVPSILNQKNSIYKIHGIGHVNLYFWGHLIYDVQNGRFRQELITATNHQKKLIELSKRLDVGIELRCKVMNFFRKKYEYYGLALMAYHRGDSSDEFKKAFKNPGTVLNDPYVRSIILSN